MHLVDDRGNPWLIHLMAGSTVERQVDSAACQMIRARNSSPQYLVASRDELDRAQFEGPLSHYYRLSIAGIPVRTQDGSHEGTLSERCRQTLDCLVLTQGRLEVQSYPPFDFYISPDQREGVGSSVDFSQTAPPLTAERLREGYERIFFGAAEELRVIQETVRRAEIRDLLAEAFERAIGIHDERDDVYRRHGGMKTPPSTRPPSKLHPLVQLDEQLRKQAEET